MLEFQVDAKVSPQDSRQATRMVGFLEYGQALARFEALVTQASPEELLAFDQIVKERDELAVFTNLSRRFPHVASSLDEPARAGDNFERRSLAWMMALARVELGAILAGFTDVPRPFEAVMGTRYGFDETTEMLQDGLRTHYWALINDPNFGVVVQKKVPDQESLAYIRRLVLTRALHSAATRIVAPRYSPAQLSELRQWKERLDGVQVLLVTRIQVYLEDLSQRSSIRNDAFLANCSQACQRAVGLSK